MKPRISSHKLLRLGALSLLLLVPLADLAGSGFRMPFSICMGLWCSLQLLLLYPTPQENILPSSAACGAAIAMSVALRLLGAPVWLFVLSGSLLVYCFILHRATVRYANVPPLFMVSTVWAGTLDYLCLMHASAFLFSGVLMLVLMPWKPSAWALTVLMAAFFCIHYYRIYTRSTVFLGKKKEALIKQGQKGSGYKMPIQYVDSDSRSAVLFNDVVKIMETKKPYLQDDFDLEDLSRLTRTNRLYLSKSINFHAGRNFNQLVNYYRVKYAVALMKKDPDLKMSEIAEMSGFHTTVSFNMAFKLNEHTTPSEYARSLRTIN